MVASFEILNTSASVCLQSTTHPFISILNLLCASLHILLNAEHEGVECTRELRGIPEIGLSLKPHPQSLDMRGGAGGAVCVIIRPSSLSLRKEGLACETWSSPYIMLSSSSSTTPLVSM